MPMKVPAFHTRSAVIDISADATYSEVIDFTKWGILAVRVPAGATGEYVRLVGSNSKDGTFAQIYAAGVELGGTFEAGTWFMFDEWIPLPYLKLYLTDASNVAVEQSADVTLEVVLKS